MIRNLLIATAVGSVFAAGCRHRCCHKDPCPPRPIPPAAGGNPYLLPPAGLPTTPGSPGGAAVVPPVAPGDPRNYPPPVLDAGPTNPAKPAPEVLFPDPVPGSGSSRSSYPGNSDSPVVGPPVRPQTAEPPVSQQAASPRAGLPGFATAKEGIASGRKPTLEGFDTLKSAGYRTVVYLHPAGADPGAVRDVATKRGLAFVAIEATPEKLAAAAEQFNTVVADKAARPAYVFDDDGVRAGALWYLHFRTAESENDDAARVRAKPLGLTEEGEEAKAFWHAIQRYLETR